MRVKSSTNGPLGEAVLELLRTAPEGLSEHQLIAELARGDDPLLKSPFADLVSTFRSHCRLFNTLYRLRDALWDERMAHLDINPLRIRLLPYCAARAGVAETDALREYYLNLDRLDDVDETEVARLLASFYAKLKGGPQRTRALAALGLEDPVTDPVIKQTYRRLAQRHHPDRGGDKARLQQINAAMAVLFP